MLVLSRKRDEQIVVGENVIITIVEIRGDKVRLGIEAPPHIPVHRSEVYEAILRASAHPDNAAAAKPEGTSTPGNS